VPRASPSVTRRANGERRGKIKTRRKWLHLRRHLNSVSGGPPPPPASCRAGRRRPSREKSHDDRPGAHARERAAPEVSTDGPPHDAAWPHAGRIAFVEGLSARRWRPVGMTLTFD
jgi:hypothetical protein